MKAKPRGAVKSMKAQKKKPDYRNAVNAIEKKLVEIKKETASRGAVNNNLTLFRYLV
jgi:hypothetical protein